jgi:curved DNA-binding protein CbpA
MTPYEVLGVPRTATPPEIRRAYLELARRHHPDFHTGDGEATRAASAERMRSVNDAWRVLSDADRRRAYDERTRPENSTSAGWIPPDDDDDWDPSMLDDTPLNGVKPTRPFALAPFGLFAAGVVLVVVGFVVSAGLTALGLILIALSAISFFVVPFLTMAESRKRDLGG